MAAASLAQDAPMDTLPDTDAAGLHLMHLVSPALPVGAYAYSQGLEWAIEDGWLRDKHNPRSLQPLQGWLEGLLQRSLATLDLPVLARCIAAWERQDMAAVQHWNDFLRAARETHELLLEDEQMGMALARLLKDLGIADAAYPASPCYVIQFALACRHWRIGVRRALSGFAWSWLENQVAAATKLVPLGQTQAQQLLLAIMPQIKPACATALQLCDAELGQSLPGLALASAHHERQYSRLFRS